jgi:hypothetical protein
MSDSLIEFSVSAGELCCEMDFTHGNTWVAVNFLAATRADWEALRAESVDMVVAGAHVIAVDRTNQIIQVTGPGVSWRAYFEPHVEGSLISALDQIIVDPAWDEDS